MSSPIFSIIALSYNHEKYIKEALESILGQTFKDFELIVIDDCSTDQTSEIARLILKDVDHVFLQNKENMGNCKSFNKALLHANGKYIIDLSTDDILLSNRLEEDFQVFESLGDDFGVIHGNAICIDQESNLLKEYHPKDKIIPSGDVYEAILQKHLICPPSVTFKKEALDQINGYDENLAFEDFDAWIRLARNWKFYYHGKLLTYKRYHSASLSMNFYTPEKAREMHLSVYETLKKAYLLNRTESENTALLKRIQYEMRRAVSYNQHQVGILYLDFLKQMGRKAKADTMIRLMLKKKFNFYAFRKLLNLNVNS